MKKFMGVVCATLLMSTVSQAADTKLLIGSTSASSSHYGYFVAVGKLINEKVPGVKTSIVETGATMDNIRRMSRGQLDLGLVTTNVAQHAVSGTNAFKGKQQDLKLLWVYTGAPQNVVVRKDAGVHSLAELKGVRFNPGIKGSATEATTEAVFKSLNLSADFVRGSTTDIVGAIKDNRVSGYVKSGSGNKLDSSTMDIATTTDIEVLSLTDAQAKELRSKMPDISVIDVKPAEGKGYKTWSFGVGVAASSKLPEETAYQIVKTIMADKTVQANAMAALKGANVAERTLKFGTFKLHPGAARWFKEQGIEIPAALAPGQ